MLNANLIQNIYTKLFKISFIKLLNKKVIKTYFEKTRSSQQKSQYISTVSQQLRINILNSNEPHNRIPPLLDNIVSSPSNIID